MAEETKRGRKRTLTDSTRKNNRKKLQTIYNKTRINIGSVFERWLALKTDLNLHSHEDVAKVLLDSNSESCISGVEEIITSRRRPSKAKECNSFINPFDLSIDVTEVEGSKWTDDEEDENYVPSFNITLREGLKMTDLHDEDEDSEDEAEESEKPEIDASLGTTCNQVKTHEEMQEFLSDHPCITYCGQLLKLANLKMPESCTNTDCGAKVGVVKEVVASAVYLIWICQKGHTLHRWCSQPVLNRGVHSGDLMLASSVVLSGSNFQKVTMFAKFLQLPILSKSTFYRMQRHYIVPSVREHWIDHQNSVLEDFRGLDLVILGDGRMDSPGHSAQYCSYTFMEYTTKKILCIITLDKRMVDKKSTNLERACFVKGLEFLLSKDMKIVEVVTDAHLQISSLMKKDYPDIKHSYDVWHGTKNLGKKIIKAGQEKKNQGLLAWTKDVVNHFWYTAQISSSIEDFKGTWIGVLHHVVNVHEWILSYSSTNKCDHGPLTSEREKGWLERDSPAHVALRHIVLDKRLLNNIPYYLNFRSTAELETFQNLILMYASKRHSYTPPVYQCRNLLAALDHNCHTDRSVITNKDGSGRYQRVFQKKSCRWSVTPCKIPKEYQYIPQLMQRILVKRLNDNIGMNQILALEVDDPRRLSAHLAPIPPPPTCQIVNEQKSRFKSTDDMDKTIDYWME
uniref:Uncharacterized protein LOC111137607 isoform X2 n=1 Tax=Crassostrea virginica TaxID=6565 RepID=A0A8B8EY44_CRAVI|nr:uncharacterized protein LOC111137607 isoform X2 [Crassostrea virginica]